MRRCEDLCSFDFEMHDDRCGHSFIFNLYIFVIQLRAECMHNKKVYKIEGRQRVKLFRSSFHFMCSPPSVRHVLSFVTLMSWDRETWRKQNIIHSKSSTLHISGHASRAARRCRAATVTSAWEMCVPERWACLSMRPPCGPSASDERPP